MFQSNATEYGRGEMTWCWYMERMAGIRVRVDLNDVWFLSGYLNSKANLDPKKYPQTQRFVLLMAGICACMPKINGYARCGWHVKLPRMRAITCTLSTLLHNPNKDPICHSRDSLASSSISGLT